MVSERVSRHIHVRTSVWVSAAISVVLVCFYLYWVSLPAQAFSPRTQAKTIPTQTIHVPSCTPISFSDPTAVNLTNMPSGVSIVDDPAAYYQIYGATANQLRNQIRQCAPNTEGDGGEFTGQTAYTITWRYNTTVGDTCSLINVKVGLHITTTLPIWQPTNSATNGLPTRWQNFMTNLRAHEAGHAALDKLYAQQILDDLNTVPSMDCAKLDTVVKHIVNTDIAILNMANNNYDTTTNHGATQGAVLPTH